ncbi:oxidoreductase [Rhodococcoides kyotonense]|uniref:Probable oxidoreductase n=1 Tax=Rhodococcoides kyotonense TaxID=398843 RepID=A0A239MCY8_9NOCA|nr:oxidoreductase [Rhodococcus kyotonensis]SNT40887.1 NAD(P)-dependent dehydrogenase, short-chain alcohol dehydrogenase family [Rhodococcus kyotonensis]
MPTTQQRIGSGFGAHSTVDDVLAGIDLTGRTAVVTGGYSGLGLEVTRGLAAAGAQVIVPARRPDMARDNLIGEDRVRSVACDLSDLAGVARCARDIRAMASNIDFVICNAGIMAVPLTRVGDGWESHFAVNHLGHYALVNHLSSVLTGGCRVVAVSSSGHFQSPIRWNDMHFRDGYDRWVAYGQSKTANALFAVHLNGLLESAGGRVFSVHPGSILTPLQRHVPDEEQIRLGWRDAAGESAEGFKTPVQGAATAVWAATSPALMDHGGAYLQDCDVAESATGDDMLVGGVKPWAVDPADAERLWEVTASLVGTDSFS